ncbi:MAG: NagC family transcriptional regulator [Ardenticatenaceae bacterium]|nr:MAG: NagC family transcriptional regulator [Ardenticatenaceae bacterium]
MQAAHLFVGLDVGGTNTAVLVTDEHGQAVAEITLPTQANSPQVLLNSLSEAIHTALAKANATPPHIRRIGLGVPGHVDPATGIVHLAVNLNLQMYPLGQALGVRFKSPIYLENDVRTAAIGTYEHLYKTKSVQDIAYLSIGTGIAAGVILNGRLHRGSNGLAGEIGHVVVEPGGALCNCGLRGCLETIVSGPAILRQFAQIDPDANKDGRTPADIYRLATEGHPAAQTVVQHVSQHLAQAIHRLLMLYDVEKVVLGGGVTHSGAAFFQPILQALTQLRRQSPLAESLLREEKLHLLPTNFNPGAWGAIHLARNGIPR